MSGLLRRLTRRRPATADETGPGAPESSEPAGAPAETPAEPGGGQPVPAAATGADWPAPATGGDWPAPATGGDRSAADEPATQVLPATGEHTVAIPAPATVRDLPAGIDPTEYASAAEASAPRGKLRRRLRYLRRVRDLLLRDLGGFTFEIHRTAGGTADETQRRLVEAKLNRIAALDGEVRALEGRLGEPHQSSVLRESGIGGTCPECGELFASEAHYCARCGTPLDAKARARRDAAVATAAQQTTGSQPVAEPAPASVLWAAGPRPAAKPEPEAEPEEPQSEVTSQWLMLPPRRETDEEPVEAAGPADAPTADEPAPAEMAEGPTPAEMAEEPTPAEMAEGPTPAEMAGEPAPAEMAGEPAAAEMAGEPAPAETAGEPAPAETVEEPVAGEPAPAETAEEPVAGECAAAETTEAPTAEAPAPPKPKRARAKKPPADEPAFEPAPNGRPTENLQPPADPLTSQRDQTS